MAKTSGTENFCELDSPRYEAAYAGPPPDFDGELKVISWNIKFSREIETAIVELKIAAELRDADIMLLQEMDEVGVEEISQALHYNYIYYPAAIHCRTSKCFGNAILSRWPISNARKVILPHVSPRTGEIRIATRSHVTVDGQDILVYSVHTETFALSAERRRQQFRSLVADIKHEDHGHVLVGGDFNTVKKKSVLALDEIFNAAGMERISAGASPTIKTSGLGFTLDHIYARGVTLSDKGVWPKTRASDHFPVWHRISLQ